MRNYLLRCTRPLVAMVGIVAASVTLSACAPEFEGYQATPTIPKRPIAEWATSDLSVRFEPGSAKLASGESSRIAAALAAEDPTRPIRAIARTNADGTTPKLAVERAAALRDVLAGHGVTLEYQGPKAAGGGSVLPDPEQRDSAMLYIAHHEVTVPGCPDWRKPFVTDFTNTPSSNYGCANAINLGLMIAHPDELTHGKSSGGADGTREAKAITDYRTGKAPRVAKPDLPPVRAAQSLTTSN